VARGDEVVLYHRGNHTPEGARRISADRARHAAFEARMAEAGTFDCVIDMVGYDPEDARGGRTARHCSTPTKWGPLPGPRQL